MSGSILLGVVRSSAATRPTSCRFISIVLNSRRQRSRMSRWLSRPITATSSRTLSGTPAQVATTHSFDATLRGLASETFTGRRLRFRDFGTTVVMSGPRFPTLAESRFQLFLSP